MFKTVNDFFFNLGSMSEKSTYPSNKLTPQVTAFACYE